MIYSIDIFDTLLLRDEHPEATLMRLPEHYRTERLALHRSHYPQTLSDFYSSISENIQSELDLECDHLDINTEIIDFIKAHSGDTFILISDMYLTSQHIQYIFKQLSVPVFYKGIYISCEYNCSKEAWGKLFERVSEDYGTEITHIGDNLKSDFINATSKLMPAVHYVKQSYSYKPDYTSGEAYYKNYVDNILCPLMYLSLQKIKMLVKDKKLNQIICIGSVYEFYKALLQPHFPELEIKKLEISRYNICFMLYTNIDTNSFVKLPHTYSFLKHYYPEEFQEHTNFEEKNLIERWSVLSSIIKEKHSDLAAKSIETIKNLENQLEDKKILPTNILFVDFGYQGTFCEIFDAFPVLQNNNNHVFLTTNELNPKRKCEFGVQITPFKMPTKAMRDPFWILDAEIIIKKGSKTPLAFTKDKGHINSLGWTELYEYLLDRVAKYSPPTNLYALERDLTYKIFVHICTINHQFVNVFNWLCKKVQYNLYSLTSDEEALFNRYSGIAQIDIGNIEKFELKNYGFTEFSNSANTGSPLNCDKKNPFYLYFKYLESIEMVRRYLTKL